MLGALRPLLDYPELIPVVIHQDQPVMRWMLGTDRPDQLLEAIEEAMVADRVPGAEGRGGQCRQIRGSRQCGRCY